MNHSVSPPVVNSLCESGHLSLRLPVNHTKYVSVFELSNIKAASFYHSGWLQLKSFQVFLSLHPCRRFSVCRSAREWRPNKSVSQFTAQVQVRILLRQCKWPQPGSRVSNWAIIFGTLSTVGSASVESQCRLLTGWTHLQSHWIKGVLLICRWAGLAGRGGLV